MSDHRYHKRVSPSSQIKIEEVRRPSVILSHGHSYSKPTFSGSFWKPKKSSWPKKSSAPKKSSKFQKSGTKRLRGDPIDETLPDLEAVERRVKVRKVKWTAEETDFAKSYVSETPRASNESLAAYWERCATALNKKLPESPGRNGFSCKSLAQRLSITPTISTFTTVQSLQSSPKPTACCTSTQTDLTLPVKQTGSKKHQEGEWIFMTPSIDLKEDASKGATLLNTAALRRLRRFTDLPASERAHLIDLLCNSSSDNLARAILSSSLGEEIKCMIVNDTELEAKDCATRSSVLHRKGKCEFPDFEWDSIIAELSDRQPFLLDILLAAALPTGKIGNQEKIEALKPVIGCLYGIAMKQRFNELLKVHHVMTTALRSDFDKMLQSLQHDSKPIPSE